MIKKTFFLEEADIEKNAKKYVLENANGMRLDETDYIISLAISQTDGFDNNHL